MGNGKPLRYQARLKAWARGELPKYLLPSETVWFQKLSLAIALNELDEAVIDRQRPVWLRDLAAMLRAQNNPEEGQEGEISEARARAAMAALTGKG
jgi:streptogramin lyase